ncbi:MAG: pyruvate dehydrogenase complex dihydrolipoamide acetyltransferase [Kiloniellales bacterium]|nr:pyruvate dehydrogenase complex dihydrolipoamide acetyltransferase [Kiloniellales bacterium]MDJ0983159.1 pyruvate dehydrogenase complex dihydrolipoamide acetyltransferase [Kiloniellales bacterium]
MPINILMPALSPTMTEGTLAKWHVKEGDDVASGDVVAEIETDKATMEVEAVEEGTVGKLLIAEGTEGVAVNTPIAVLLEEGEDAAAIAAAPAAPPPPAAAPAPAATGNGSAPAAAPAPQAASPAPQPAAAPSGNGAGRTFASPLARRMAEQAGLDLGSLKGSGPHGRIIKVDIEAALAGGAPAAPAAPAPGGALVPTPAAVPATTGPSAKELADLLGMTYQAVANSNVRKTIARRLGEAKQTIPHFYLSIDCELDKLLAVRKELNARGEDFKLSVNDFVIRASALALKAVPAANASWTDAEILLYDHADVSVAVATPSGLITPVIRQAEGKGLAQISNEMKDLAGRAREGKLKPEEYQGGTFSVSNLGMFGITEFSAIINPPQGCILAVGAGQQRPVVKDGALAVATVMTCTLSVDHRVVDGAVGAEFLAAFKKLIEDPLAMLL